MVILLSALIFLRSIVNVHADCASQNHCNGHGICNDQTNSCECFDGYGAATDVTLFRAADCSARTCPSHRAWSDIPSSTTIAHAVAECSNRGACDRVNGVCICMDGFVGAACQRMACPNDCSGHGLCVSIKQMARMSNALPLGPNTYYEGDEAATTWDDDMAYGCVCDSSWAVGLGKNETQEPEWFGPDCSKRHCPSGDDPRTTAVETNCYQTTAANAGGNGTDFQGEYGNLCQVDCSNRGLCDYRTGTCYCFDGFYGTKCDTITDNTYGTWNDGT